MIVSFLDEMSQEIMRIGKNKHDKNKQAYRFYFYDTEGNQGNDTSERHKAIEAVHFHVSKLSSPDKSLLKAWVKFDDSLVVAENYLGKDSKDVSYILKEAENNIDKIKNKWKTYFGEQNTVYYGTKPEKEKTGKKRHRKLRK